MSKTDDTGRGQTDTVSTDATLVSGRRSLKKELEPSDVTHVSSVSQDSDSNKELDKTLITQPKSVKHSQDQTQIKSVKKPQEIVGSKEPSVKSANPTLVKAKGKVEVDKQSKPAEKSKKNADQTILKPAKRTENQTVVRPEKTTLPPAQKVNSDPTSLSARLAGNSKATSKPENKSKAGKKAVEPTLLSKNKMNGGEQTQPTESLLNVGEIKSPQDYAPALTKIRKVVINQDDSRGFAKAQRAADKALEDDKIVLNSRFVLEKILGAGGMGTVYRARDLRKVEANDLNPYVAVKVLNEDFKNHPDAFVVLQREASRSHTLAHPNIVTVHDFDRDGDVIYMTMELLDGKPLDVMLRDYKETGLDKEQALSIIEGFSKALIYAHHKHIIHSDLKPGNVFITEEGGVKILDFGTARIASQAMAQGDFDAGTLGALTPAYATLEMLSDDVLEETHPADDIYAAGLIAYELLTGRHPYDRKPADKALIENLKPKRISKLTKRQWKTLESALKLRREDRLHSMDEFFDGLIKKKKFPVFKVASIFLLGVAGWFGYQQYMVPSELTLKVNAAFAGAQQCFSDGDYQCAIDKAKVVTQLSPEHAEAMSLLGSAQTKLFEKKVAALAQNVNQSLADGDIVGAREQLNLLRSLSPDGPEIQKAEVAIEEAAQAQTLTALIQSAQECLTAKKYQCAKNSASEALRLDEGNADAKKILDDANKSLAAIASSYSKYFNQAKQCFSKQKYDCAIESAQKAMSYSYTNEAAALKQKAELTKAERERILAIASKNVNDGRACLRTANNSCALASANAALSVVPGYGPALKLKRDAEAAIRKLWGDVPIQ